MRLLTFVSATATLSALAAADDAAAQNRNAVSNMASFDASQPWARVTNRCSFSVYVWSVHKGKGCPISQMVTLQPGDVYHENYFSDPNDTTGISIKLSKSSVCSSDDITQLEYYLQMNGTFDFNYLDVSYVNCQSGNCPTRQEGYYLQSGSQQGNFVADPTNKICPVLSCHDTASCDAISYVLPDDPQTRSCDRTQNLDFYMCGGQAPGAAPPPGSSSPPASSYAASSYAASSYAAPSPSQSSSDCSSSIYKANVAAVTDSPDIPVVPQGNIKTEVVYVTKYINAKRHGHAHAEAHARRHAKFHA